MQAGRRTLGGQRKRQSDAEKSVGRLQLRPIHRQIPSPRSPRHISLLTKIKEAVVKRVHQVKTFYSSPCSKFVFHTLAYLLYVGFFAYVLLTRSTRSIRINQIPELWKECTLLLWQVCYICDTVYSYSRDHSWPSKNPADIIHNAGNAVSWYMMMMSLVMPISSLAAQLRMVSFLLFYFSFIFSTLRTMRVLAADAFFGAVVLMIRKMARLLGSFLMVFILFWFAFAVSVNSLTAHDTPTSLAWKLFSSGAFEIFGELQDAQREGNVTGCADADMTGPLAALSDLGVQCLFRSWAVPLLLFGYVFIVSVLLVNLVVAFFTSAYDEVREGSQLYYRYKQYERLVEYEGPSKIYLPPPLSIFGYIWHWFYRCCPSCKKKTPQHRHSHLQSSSAPNGMELVLLRDEANAMEEAGETLLGESEIPLELAAFLTTKVKAKQRARVRKLERVGRYGARPSRVAASTEGPPALENKATTPLARVADFFSPKMSRRMERRRAISTPTQPRVASLPTVDFE